MLISIQQPEYWPWIGFFDKVRQVDEVVLFDTVQFKPRYFENRVRIRSRGGKNGWQWLRVPIKGVKHRQLIKDVGIDNTQNWRKENWKALGQNYSKSPFWSKYAAEVEEIYAKEWQNLVDLNIATIKWLSKKLGLRTKFICSSQIETKGKADDLLVDICKCVKATEYLSGKFGKDYIDPKKFKRAGVKLKFQEFTHPQYYQFQGKFEPYMSTLDLLFNEGEKSNEILKSVTS